MLKMLLEKRKSNASVEELIENDCLRYQQSLDSFDLIINEFRNQFPELCAPELSKALLLLENSRDQIRTACCRKGRVPDASYCEWSSSINTAIQLFRMSLIQLPEIEEDQVTE